MKDAVAFMRWERVVPWKILSMVARPEEPLVPVGFGANYNDFQNLLTPGSHIWVVTRISTEFSLAGRVTVKAMLDRTRIPKESWPSDLHRLLETWKFVARADPDNSAFFETNNAQAVLDRYQISFVQNRTIAYSDSPLANSFRPSMEQARNTVFLSYRWKEGRRFAIALARAFRKRGWSPWLDALSIPGYEEKGGPEVNKQRLEQLIKLGIEKCQFAVVINTETFGQRYWTREELNHIRRNNVPWVQVMRGGELLECKEPPIRSRAPEAVVEEILERRA